MNKITKQIIRNFTKLSPEIKNWINKVTTLCDPVKVHVCDGSLREKEHLIEYLLKTETLKTLKAYNNCYLALSDPRDVARTESRTFLSTKRRQDSIPNTRENVQGTLGNWLSIENAEIAINERFPNCMKGRTMYVVPFALGPKGPFAKFGIQITDSAYVALSLGIMTRMGSEILKEISSQDNFVQALHSCGGTGIQTDYPNWPCDPEKLIVIHKPETNEIFSYGSGYGGNALLPKKCYALRLASWMAKDEGWLAEHMLILGIEPITNFSFKQTKKRYIAAAFPSACGKTNLAMLKPSIDKYKITTVGDDIAWMRFNEETGFLHAVNPEIGFFGVATGTSWTTNPNAMATIFSNTIFTNVAETSDGGVWWEGMEAPNDTIKIKDWYGKEWDKNTSKTPAAHPNCRFTTPASQCPVIDYSWQNPDGVPISAFIFGGRRPEGIPLVFESPNWNYGVLVGCSLKSEATAAAEHRERLVMNDPFAMRPFFGYNFIKYLEHWLDIKYTPKINLPKIFHVNWFLRDENNKFIWPGFGENIRVLDWIMKRIEDDNTIAEETAYGIIPTKEGIDFSGMMPEPNYNQLFPKDRKFWETEIQNLEIYLDQQTSGEIPQELEEEIYKFKKRIKNM